MSPKPKNRVRGAVAFVVTVLSITVLITLLKGSGVPQIPESSVDEIHAAFLETPLPQKLFGIKGVVTGYWEQGYLLQVTLGAHGDSISPGFLVESQGELPLLSDSIFVTGNLTERMTFSQRQFYPVQALPQPAPIQVRDPLPDEKNRSLWAKLENLRVEYLNAPCRVSWTGDRIKLIPLISKNR